MIEYKLERRECQIDMKEYLEGGYVDVDTFLECCRACPNYGKVWSCPPYDFDPDDYWREFSSLYIVGNKIVYPEGTTKEEAEEALWEVKKLMKEELFLKEKEYKGSQSLFAGNCDHCGRGNCTRAEEKPCRFPDLMRYSIESVGGNVGKTIEDFLGFRLCWCEEGKAPPYFVLVGGLLIK